MSINVSETAELVRAYFAEQASRWKLSSASLRVDYVPSPGGFGPMNFTVHDDHSSYHVKLNKERDELSAWVRASERLAGMYRAPRFLGQIELAGRYGAVFERLPGESPSLVTPTPVLDEIVALLLRLHGDLELAKLLGSQSRPARDTLLRYHIEMCAADLDEIEPAVSLSFVDKASVAWMRAETNALRDAAMGSAAFDEMVSSPIHGDLWFGNVLIDKDRWWIIDWDDLKIGDPAHDLSLILFTALDRSQDASRWLRDRNLAFMERFQLYARAALLTFVIDPIADWIEAESFPDVRDAARAHREGLHRWALTRYRDLYGA